MQTEGQNQISTVAAGHGNREVVVDAFLQFVQDGQAEGGGEVDLRLQDGINGSGGRQRMDGHDESLKMIVRLKNPEGVRDVIPNVNGSRFAPCRVPIEKSIALRHRHPE